MAVNLWNTSFSNIRIFIMSLPDTRTKNYKKSAMYEVSMVVECKVFKKVRANSKAEAKSIAVARQLRHTKRLADNGYIICDIEVFDALLLTGKNEPVIDLPLSIQCMEGKSQ
jgi:RIO-like serine/threonine protein kinase